MYLKNLPMGIFYSFMSFIMLASDISISIMILTDKSISIGMALAIFVIPLFASTIIVILFFSIFSKEYSLLYRVKIDQIGIVVMFGKKIKQKYLWGDFVKIERGFMSRAGYELIFSLRKAPKALQIEILRMGDRRKIRKAIIANCTNPKIVQFISNL